MLFNIIIGTIMGLAFIGIIVCGKKQNDNSAAKPLAMVFMLVIAVCGVALLIKYNKGVDPEKYKKESLVFQKSQSFILAEYLKKGLSSPQVVVLLDKSKYDDPMQKALKEGLKEGFSDINADVVFETPLVKIPEDKIDSQTNIMNFAKAKDINFILETYPKCKVLITLIGLPKDLANLDIVKKFQEEKPIPKIACLNGGFHDYQQLIKVGFITAATVPDPKKKFTTVSTSRNMQETFDKKFLLITPKNVDEIAKKYPGRIFKTPPK